VVAALAALPACATTAPLPPDRGAAAARSDAAVGLLEYPHVMVESYPSFSECALGDREEVAVTMRVSIDETGAVRDVVVIDSSGAEFDQRAKKAMFGFRFAPARAHGVPIRIKIPYRFVFRRRAERSPG
jgi:TonB family protein